MQAPKIQIEFTETQKKELERAFAYMGMRIRQYVEAIGKLVRDTYPYVRDAHRETVKRNHQMYRKRRKGRW